MSNRKNASAKGRNRLRKRLDSILQDQHGTMLKKKRLRDWQLRREIIARESRHLLVLAERYSGHPTRLSHITANRARLEKLALNIR